MRSLVISFISAIVLAACAAPPKQTTAGPDAAKPADKLEPKPAGLEPGKPPDSGSKPGGAEPKAASAVSAVKMADREPPYELPFQIMPRVLRPPDGRRSFSIC